MKLDKIVAVSLLVVAVAAGLAVYEFFGPPATPSVAATPKPSTVPTPGPPPQNGYLVLKNWGLKLPASGVLANLSYHVGDNGYVSFYSTDLYPKYRSCSPEAQGVGVLKRWQHGKKDLQPYPVAAGTINGYDYTFATSTPTCANGTKDAQLNQDVVNALTDELKQLELVPAS